MADFVAEVGGFRRVVWLRAMAANSNHPPVEGGGI
jgi:hypothetical protein